MTQFRKLRLIKQKAAKAAAAGPVRRVIFGDLPDWATVSRILLLTHGGAVEYAWNEEGTVAVQFVEGAACLDYHEKHSDGIKYVTADGEEAIITVTMPEEGLRDHAELAQRVAEGASRVVCLEGLAPGFKDGDGTPILGVLAQDEWHDLKFERILITQAEVSSETINTMPECDPLLTVFSLVSMLPSLSTICTMPGSSTRTSRMARMTVSPALRLTRKFFRSPGREVL